MAGALLLAPGLAGAYPPAPEHTIYGQVRNEYGEPLTLANARIIFSPTDGFETSGDVVPGLAPGMNYRLRVPMDSGITPDLYKISALRPNVNFRIRVKIGTVTYLPMEMVGSYNRLGLPAQSTRIDLTLGVDANNDGLPDAWQELLRTLLGPDVLIGPNDDSDGDGISNLDEYLAGTYAFDPSDGFRLTLVPRANASPLLEFMVISPRTYTLYTSTNLQTWTPLDFRVAAAGTNTPALRNFRATEIHRLQVEPVLPAGGLPLTRYFYKVQAQ